MTLFTPCRIVVLLLGCAGVGVLHGNKALDLLEADSDNPAPFPVPEYEETAPPSTEETRVEVTIDPSLPDRWNTELPSRFPLTFGVEEVCLNEVAFRGLFEWRYDGGELSSDREGDIDIDSSRMRRTRLGVALRGFYNTELEAESLFDGGGNYRGIETLKVRVPLSEAIAMTVGKFPPSFTLEYTQDAAVRWTSELSPLVAQMVPASSLGVQLDGRSASGWEWKAGWFSGDADPDVPSFEGDGFLLAGLAYGFNGVPPSNGAAGPGTYHRWHLDYIYNLDENSESVPFGYRHLVATGLQVSSGRADLMGDILFANGSASSAWGVTLSGAYWLMEDALRLVARYNYANSNDPGGVLSGWGVPDGSADATQPFAYPLVRQGGELHAFYAGLNVHLYEDNLILSSGLEWRAQEDVIGGETPDTIDSFVWQTGGRMAF